MRKSTTKIIGVKFSPDSSDNELLAGTKILMKYEKIYVNLGNTKSVKSEDVGVEKDLVWRNEGGLSGPALYDRTKEMVSLIRNEHCLNFIPIIATGGIDSADKVIELQELGANLVGMASAVVLDMYCIPRINKQLAHYYKHKK
jgi:dihydroorotate dehydrogenase